MPPKTGSAGKIMGTVVTKKVVKETVQVVVSPTQDYVSVEDIHNAVASSSKEEKKKVEVISTPSAPPLIRNIPVEDTSDREEKETQPLDEDETQPADSQELPSPPPLPPQEAAKKRKETPESSGKGTRKKKRARVGSGEVGLTSLVYKRYIYRVLKQVHPEIGMSSKAMAIVNNMMNDMCERVAEEAAKLSAYSKKKTLSSLDIQGAVKLVLPGELGKHAIAEGTKAVTRYVSNVVMGQSDKN